MLPEALLAATLLTAAVLLVSGVAKVRDEDPLASWEAMGVPDRLRRRSLARWHAWGEVALGMLLVALPTPWSTSVAAVVVLLFAVYLALIARVVAGGEPATCNCFGSLGSGVVDRWTVVRNTVLVVVAGLSLVDLWVNGWAASRLVDALGWVAALAVTAAVTALVVREGAGPEVDDLDDVDDYLRLPIPDVPVVEGAGLEPRSLREVAADKAMLLVLLSPGCGPCRQTTGHLSEWVEAIPEVDVRVVSQVSHAQVLQFEPRWDGLVLHEPGGSVGKVFGLHGRPAAVLLGADGLLAGGPVRGYADIVRFVDDIRAELDAARV